MSDTLIIIYSYSKKLKDKSSIHNIQFYFSIEAEVKSALMFMYHIDVLNLSDCLTQ